MQCKQIDIVRHFTGHGVLGGCATMKCNNGTKCLTLLLQALLKVVYLIEQFGDILEAVLILFFSFFGDIRTEIDNQNRNFGISKLLKFEIAI